MTGLTDLREVVDVVIGVDTHVHSKGLRLRGGHRQRDRWCARRDHRGGDAAGYAELVEFANRYPMMRACSGRRDRRPRRRLEPAPAGVIGARRRVGPFEAVRATQRREVGSLRCDPSRA